MKIAVALSGGRDSALAAALLLREGMEVEAFHLLLCPDEYAALPAEAQLETVRRLSRKLGIRLTVLDLREEFTLRIIAPFRESYRRGETPNPCILCNRFFKFGRLLEKARQAGCERLASGHYARTGRGRDGRYLLKKSRFPGHEESYFLCRLRQEQLGALLFPLGEISPEEKIRLLKEDFGGFAFLPTTQEACFLNRVGLKRFLGPAAAHPGEIVNPRGEELGEHPGYQYYTVGQRRGLGSASGKKGPLYVIRVDPGSNRVVAGEKKDLFSRRLRAVEPNWISIPELKEEMPVEAAIRYTHHPARAVIRPAPDRSVEVEFRDPQESVTPGQAVVFYQGDTMVGGAWIKPVLQAGPRQ
jgi:tRNA-specific 2-thiouridylase